MGQEIARILSLDRVFLQKPDTALFGYVLSFVLPAFFVYMSASGLPERLFPSDILPTLPGYTSTVQNTAPLPWDVFVEGKALVQGTSFLPLYSFSIPKEGYRFAEVHLLDITGYSSTFDQTDGDPYITASNQNVRWGTVATNFPEREEALPFGTKIRIPELFGDEIFTVEDRMNRRFNNRLDVWFPSRSQASQFGIHRDIAVEIFN